LLNVAFIPYKREQITVAASNSTRHNSKIAFNKFNYGEPMQLQHEIDDETPDEPEAADKPKTMHDYLEIWFMHNARLPDRVSPQRMVANAARAFDAALG
jgi:hypothetical protein